MTASPRHPAPDLTRGVMLAFIAMANVAWFVIGDTYGPRQHVVEDGVLDRIVTFLVVALVDGRAFPLFALLFGYGIARTSSRGTDGAADARRRCWVLLLLGAVHAVLLFPGDILGTYGVLGLVLVAARAASDRALLRAAAWWLPASCAVIAVVHGLPGDGGERGFLWSLESVDLLEVLALRPLEWVMTPFVLLPTASAAIVGVLAARHDLLSHVDAWASRLRGIAVIGLALAVVGGVPSGLVASGVLSVTDPVALVPLAFVHALTGVAGGIGAGAAFVLLAERRRGWASGPLGALGRRSLSGYLALSLAFAVVLHPLGLGLGDDWGTAATTVFALAVWGLTVALARWLERHGRPGPAEALQRRLARPRWQTDAGTTGAGRTRDGR